MGTPEEIYNKPINRFVAEFIGTTNLVTGQVVDEPDPQGGMGAVSFPGEYGAVKIRCPFTREMELNGKVVLSLRTERIATSLFPPENTENVFPAKVVQKTFLGDSLNYYLNVGEHRFRVKTGADVVAVAGQDVYLSVQPKDVIVLPPE